MYIGVIIPQYLPYNLTYRVPNNLEYGVRCGVRVELPSGKNRVISGIVSYILNNQESTEFELQMKDKVIRDIISIIDNLPIATETQLKLWRWCASYYMCSEGEVMRYFMPNNLIVKGIQTENGVNYSKNSGVRTEKIISLNKTLYNTDEQLNTLLDSLKRAKKQKELLLYFLENTDDSREIKYNDLRRAGFNPTIIRKGVKESIFLESMISDFSVSTKSINNKLDEFCVTETELHNSINRALDFPLLIHYSDRGELLNVYRDLAKTALQKGESTLVVISDEADKNDIIDYFNREFEENLITILSKHSQSKRYKNYSDILNGEAKVVIGNKTALGLPLNNLSLIIVTDEHSTAYKSENSPRIQGRDVALMLSHLTKSKIILDSFAPSVESYYNTVIGKYNFISIAQPLTCKITPINKYSIATKERKLYSNLKQVRYFSKLLLEKMEHTIIKGGTTLLFHNRRGYNSFKECRDCGEVLKCTNCNVSMTYHKEKNAFVCHYCGKNIPMSLKCEKCGSENTVLKGIGSENIEESIKSHFPLASILRLDSDLLNKKSNIDEARRILDNKEANIIAGTWLTIPFTAQYKINMIGVIDADTFFNIPDFRAEERAFQTLTQLALKARDGEMIIQSSKIDSPIMRDIVNNDYISMVNRELDSRKTFNYPPFVRNTCLTLKHSLEDVAYEQAMDLIDKIRKRTNINVIGPETPVIDKIRGQYILNITLRFSKSLASEQLKREVMKIIKENRYQITIDVDYL